MSSTEMRILLAGTGNFIGRLKPALDHFVGKGAKLFAMDVLDDPTGKRFLPTGTPFFNVTQDDQIRALVEAGPFQLCILSNYPSVHLATALRFDLLVEKFICPKPIDSHIEFLQTAKDERERAFQSIVSKIVVHDHYRNKPLVARLKALLPYLHGRHGFIQEIRMYITERKSTEDESERSGTLDDGLVLDLAPHAVSVLMELLPKTFQWHTNDGHRFERTDVRFDEVIGCFRARDNNCILKAGAETFAVIDLRGSEYLTFHPRESEKPHKVLDPHHFRILIVVGKGVSIDHPLNASDLKALQITFDGNQVAGNFDTNAMGGVVDEDNVKHLLPEVESRHGGLNLPFQRLADKNFDFAALLNDGGSNVTDFQDFDDAYQVTDIIVKALEHETARNISVHYETGVSSADLVNRLLSEGLDPRWQHPGPLTHLVFGRPIQKPDRID